MAPIGGIGEAPSLTSDSEIGAFDDLPAQLIR